MATNNQVLNAETNAIYSKMNLDGPSVTKDLTNAIPDLAAYTESSPNFQELRVFYNILPKKPLAIFRPKKKMKPPGYSNSAPRNPFPLQSAPAAMTSSAAF